MKDRLETTNASTEQEPRALNTADRQVEILRVGEALPAACDAHDVAWAFGKSINTVYDWQKAGKLRRFELRKPMGSKRWSGRLLQDFLDGVGSSMSLVRSA